MTVDLTIATPMTIHAENLMIIMGVIHTVSARPITAPTPIATVITKVHTVLVEKNPKITTVITVGIVEVITAVTRNARKAISVDEE